MTLLSSDGRASPREYLPAPPPAYRDLPALTREPTSEAPERTALDPGDPILQDTVQLLRLYGGVIFSGPPGTGKSWYARRIGWTLVEGEEDRIVFLQFHPSYQYEDFVQGVAPRKDGPGFEPIEKPFVRMCRAAEDDPDRSYVIVIDELSRADPGRVFGEALTYIEKSKRGLQFQLAMDEEVARVPDNLVILATMNPLDRGVDEVDAAFERRFAKIAMDPDASVVEEFLKENDVDGELRGRIVTFFRKTNDRARRNPLASIGHTFFINVKDVPSLQQLWKHQLRFLFEKAYRLDPAVFEEIEGDWHDIYRDRLDETSAEAAADDSTTS